MTHPLDRTFLRSAWRNLVALSYEADPAVLGPLVPPGLELDLFQGRAFVSIVGFLFEDARALGVPLPFCQRFEEVNLRFYVRRRAPEGWRHGVVFVGELVPRWMIAAGARWLFGEPYRTVPMRSRLETGDGGRPRPGGLLEYSWRSGGRWHRLAARAIGPMGPADPGSRDEFLVERHWGYTPRRQGALEYRVRRPGWILSAAAEPVLDADTAALYGPVVGPMLAGAPASVVIADGSEVAVSFGARVV
ncbi:MAG: DUF2071 domain-containing protein [Vicinamibacteria bacterium]